MSLAKDMSKANHKKNPGLVLSAPAPYQKPKNKFAIWNAWS